MGEQYKNAPLLKIDLSYLRDVSSGSNEFMIDMISLFLEQTPGFLDQLNESVKTQNWLKVAEIAHKIKPTLAFVGAESARLEMAEIEANARNLENIDLIAPAFEQLYERSEEIFSQLREIKAELQKAD